MSIEELKKDSEEFAKLLGTAERRRVKDALISAKAQVDKEIINLEMKLQQAAEPSTTSPKRYLCELTEYAWDQSEKFVKIFATLDGVQNIAESNVIATFEENSMNLIVTDLNGKDYNLVINNLLEPIDTENSYRKIKTGLIAIYMKKKTEGKHWDHLTLIQKRLKEKHDKEFKGDDKDSSEDALVNIMKKMYKSGDAKTKQMIAKAWTESQDKIHGDKQMDP